MEDLLAYTRSEFVYLAFAGIKLLFQKIMFKLLFILFVVKQLMDKVTSDINIYSIKPGIIRPGKAYWC